MIPALENHPIGSLPRVSNKAAAIEAELSKLVGGRVSRGDQDRISYARDMWPLSTMWARQGRVPQPPDLVCWPANEAELQAVVMLARREKVPLIPYGAGSGVCGGTWALKGGIAVDLKRFEQIGAVDAQSRCVDVGAGVIGETLERRLNAAGWTLGHFPSSIYMSTVGGWLAARSAGQLSSRYGKIEDMALSVRGVLGTGALFQTPERPFQGPDVGALLIGSEGTLGFFTQARLRVFPVPGGRAFHGFEFKTVPDGLEAIRQIFRAGLRPAVTRLYDPFDTTFVGKGKPHEGGPPSHDDAFQKEWLPRVFRLLAPQTLGRPRLFNAATSVLRKSRLILMFEGEAGRAREEDQAARELCVRLGARDLGDEPGRHWLKKRYDVSYRLSKILDAGAFADTMEVAAPWDKVYDVYERVRAAASPFAFVLCHFSHAYLEGCSLYFSFVGSAGTEKEQRERYESLWRAALSAAVSAGANVSHHHGVGILKGRALQESLGEGRHALKALKGLWDPDGIMNPGKLGL